ncbi:alanine racemase [Microbacterium sp. Se5.02b]|uniref:alanine racemase n=1 Tax=Microbacterium sp. Se5.02b TaxID=2864103 RepID=UPI001C692CDC|nr:alanine racemase [Microbacterium sp. Se5.02b]QYM62872.1 alanine racemase [Microbacterium sp. Se5.02b]
MTRPELRLRSSILRANIVAVRERVSPSALMIVLKDDAYGHGLAWAVENALRVGVDWFGSYDIRGGIVTRQLVGGEARIFAWATSTDTEIDDALLQDIDLGVGTVEYLRRIVARASVLGARARVHLKIDTGLHRNGVLAEDWASAIAETRAAEQAGLVELVGVWSHIAEASDAEDDEAQAIFLDAVRVAEQSGTAPSALHLTASAASWWRPELRGTVSRIGAFCYGIRSAEGPDLDGVTPAAQLVATVTETREEAVTIDIGSFDGLPSTLAGVTVGTPAGGRTLLRVNRTSSVVDAWTGARVGEEVVLFGPGTSGERSATALAEHIDTVGEEILTRLTSRVRRVVID